MIWLVALGLLSSPLPIFDLIKAAPTSEALATVSETIHRVAVAMDQDIDVGPADAGTFVSAGTRTSTYSGSRVIIIDGDTIALPCAVPGAGCAEKIRLLEIDTPETYQPHCEAERQAGLRAKQRMADLVRAGNIEVSRGGTDRYGRTLGNVSTGSGDVGNILLREGFALPYSPGGKAKASRIAHWCGPGKW